MWKSFEDAFRRLWNGTKSGLEEHRTTKARERFWTEVREGEREADARSRPCTDAPKNDPPRDLQTRAPGNHREQGRIPA